MFESYLYVNMFNKKEFSAKFNRNLVNILVVLLLKHSMTKVGILKINK